MAEIFPEPGPVPPPPGSEPPPYNPPPSAPLPPAPLSPADERTWAMLAHLSVLLNLVTGFFGPLAALIIYLVYKERSHYVAFHAMQSMVAQLVFWVGGGIIATVLWVLGGVLSAICVGVLLFPLALLASALPLLALILGIVGAIQTSQGQDFRYWLVGDWVRNTYGR